MAAVENGCRHPLRSAIIASRLVRSGKSAWAVRAPPIHDITVAHLGSRNSVSIRGPSLTGDSGLNCTPVGARSMARRSRRSSAIRGNWFRQRKHGAHRRSATYWTGHRKRAVGGGDAIGESAKP